MKNFTKKEKTDLKAATAGIAKAMQLDDGGMMAFAAALQEGLEESRRDKAFCRELDNTRAIAVAVAATGVAAAFAAYSYGSHRPYDNYIHKNGRDWRIS